MFLGANGGTTQFFLQLADNHIYTIYCAGTNSRQNL
jgi:hypothetical protein